MIRRRSSPEEEEEEKGKEEEEEEENRTVKLDFAVALLTDRFVSCNTYIFVRYVTTNQQFGSVHRCE